MYHGFGQAYLDKVLGKAEFAKGAFTHPVSACIFRIALQFFITYLD